VSGAVPAAAQTAGATTTTIPTVKLGNFDYPNLPKQPTSADLELVSFANSLARAAVAIYDGVIAAKTAESATEVLASFRENHRAHAGSLSALGGTGGASVANRTLVREYTTASSQPLPTLTKLEEALLATYANLLGQFSATDPAAIVASILPILSRQLVVLGELQQSSLTSYLPNFDEPSGALTPDGYPVERV
jgi:hypothetical protein